MCCIIVLLIILRFPWLIENAFVNGHKNQCTACAAARFESLARTRARRCPRKAGRGAECHLLHIDSITAPGGPAAPRPWPLALPFRFPRRSAYTEKVVSVAPKFAVGPIVAISRSSKWMCRILCDVQGVVGCNLLNIEKMYKVVTNY